MTHKLTHDWLQNLVLIQDTEGKTTNPPGSVIACDSPFLEGAPPKFQPFVAYAPGTIAPQLWNLFHSSPQLYQKLTGCYVAFELIAEMFERMNISDDNPYMKMIRAEQDGILLAQKCVQDGMKKTADQVNREDERKNRG